MASGTIPPAIVQQFFDANGNPLANGKLYVYAAGTTTPVTTYSDVGLTTPRTNPIILDGSGFLPATFLAPSSYRFQLKTSADVLVWDRDNESSVPPSNVDVDVTGTAGEDLAAGDGVYLSDGSGAKTAGRWYKAKADNAYSSSDAFVIGMMPAALLTGASGSVRIIGRVTGLAGLATGSGYYVSSATAGQVTTTPPTNRRLVGIADSATSVVLAPGPRATEVAQDALATLGGDFLGGRLTLTTGVSVTPTDVTAAGTLYYTPHVHDRIALFDGASLWNIRTLTEISIAVPALTSQMYDVFVFDNAGTPTLELLAWTNDTTRATALVRQNGRLVKTGATTRRYVGSMRTTTVANQTEDSAAKRYVWNYQHRMPRTLARADATASWSYATNSYRQANASTANQVDVVVGVAEAAIHVHAHAVATSGITSIAQAVSIGEDSTTTTVAGTIGGAFYCDANGAHMGYALVDRYPAIGRHFYAWLEKGNGTSNTWSGAGGDTLSGLSGFIQG